MVGLFLAYTGLSLSVGLIFLVRLLLYRYHYSLSTIIIIGLWLGVFAYINAFAFHDELLQWLVILPMSAGVALCYAAIISKISNYTIKQQGLLMGVTDALLSLAFTITGLLTGLLVYLNPHLPPLLSGIGNVIASVLFIIYIIAPSYQRFTSHKTNNCHHA